LSEATPGDRRARLGQTFDAASALYQQARPEYPAELIERVIEVTGIRAGDHLLEIGCATGKATLPLARRRFRVTCIEPGSNLAAVARRTLAAYPNVRVVEGRFEDVQALAEGAPFDLVFAANAWHWLDPDVRYERAWQALRRRGHLAFWDAVHVLPENGDPFFAEIQAVYEAIGEGLPPGSVVPRPGGLAERGGEVDATGLFEVVEVRQYDWETVYDADGYIALLDTFSGHIAMEQWQRDRLYEEVRRRLAERPDGMLRRHWGSALHIARRREP
jgi:SAM-dependent methyltransferase